MASMEERAKEQSIWECLYWAEAFSVDEEVAVHLKGGTILLGTVTFCTSSVLGLTDGEDRRLQVLLREIEGASFPLKKGQR